MASLNICDTCKHSFARHRRFDLGSTAESFGSCAALGCDCETFVPGSFASVTPINREKNTPYNEHPSTKIGQIMADNQTRTTPSGATITENDYQAIKKDATKDTLRNVFAMVGIVATVGFIRNRFNIKAVPVSPVKD